MGAYLTENGKVVEFFAIPISPEDEQILGVQAGGCEGQQVWECLAGLIDMRQWSPRWKHSRVHLHLRGDNVASLVMFSTLKTHSKQLSDSERVCFGLGYGGISTGSCTTCSWHLKCGGRSTL